MKSLITRALILFVLLHCLVVNLCFRFWFNLYFYICGKKTLWTHLASLIITKQYEINNLHCWRLGQQLGQRGNDFIALWIRNSQSWDSCMLRKFICFHVDLNKLLKIIGAIFVNMGNSKSMFCWEILDRIVTSFVLHFYLFYLVNAHVHMCAHVHVHTCVYMHKPQSV